MVAGRTIDDASFDALWSAASDLDVPIVTHEAYEFAPPEHKEVVGKFERQRPAET